MAAKEESVFKLKSIKACILYCNFDSIVFWWYEVSDSRPH